jgi:hypothetical protein
MDRSTAIVFRDGGVTRNCFSVVFRFGIDEWATHQGMVRRFQEITGRGA